MQAFGVLWRILLEKYMVAVHKMNLDIIDVIISDIKSVKEKNQEVIHIDALIKYLEDRKNNPIEPDAELRLKLMEFEHEINISNYKSRVNIAIKMLDMVANFAQMAIKSALIINGGAAIAILAFLGNVWKNNMDVSSVDSFIMALEYFSWGVLAGAICAGLSYIVQYLYTNEYNKFGIGIHVAAIFSICVAYVFFLLGISGVADAFLSMK